MHALIAGYCLAGLMLVGSLKPTKRLERTVPLAPDHSLRHLRRTAESQWTEYVMTSWALLAVAAAVLMLVHGRPLGWGWFGVAAMYALAIVARRRYRTRLRLILGDRGQSVLSKRYHASVDLANRCGLVTLGAYTTLGALHDIYPSDPPLGAIVVRVIFWAALAVGLAGFATIRVVILLRADNVEPVR